MEEVAVESQWSEDNNLNRLCNLIYFSENESKMNEGGSEEVYTPPQVIMAR